MRLEKTLARSVHRKEPIRSEVPDDFDLPKQNDEGFFVDDFLGQAANAGSKAREAIEVGNFNAAWGYYQEMGQLYLKHAQKERFTAAQTLVLVGSVHRAMARLLKQEERHHDALTHILYYTACSESPLNKELKGYRPYFNRCKFKEVVLDEVTDHLSVWRELPDFAAIRDMVIEWINRG